MGRSVAHWIEKKLMYSEAIDSHGETHTICRQRRRVSCGIACVAMVVYRKHGVRLLESELRGYSKILDPKTQVPSAAPGPQMFASASNKSRADGYNETDGVRANNMVIMLRKMRIEVDYRYQSGRATNVLRAATPQTPVIAGLKWASGGGHWVLVDSFDADTNRAVVCDPYHGLVECSVAGNNYSTPSGSAGLLDSTWLSVL
jgi:hypothetical protein